VFAVARGFGVISMAAIYDIVFRVFFLWFHLRFFSSII
jgi:hypothetical protein